MDQQVPRDTALTLCSEIREENRKKLLFFLSPQALQCRGCEACSGGTVVRLQAGRPCCLVRQRCVRLLAIEI